MTLEPGSYLLFVVEFLGWPSLVDRHLVSHRKSKALMSTTLSTPHPSPAVVLPDRLAGLAALVPTGLCSALQGSGSSVGSCTPQVGTTGPW